MALIITFEVEPARAIAVTDAIKSIGYWGRLTATSYIVESLANPGDLMNYLQPLLGPNDSLWVISAAAPWAAYGDPIVEGDLEGAIGASEDWIPRDWDKATSSRP